MQRGFWLVARCLVAGCLFGCGGADPLDDAGAGVDSGLVSDVDAGPVPDAGPAPDAGPPVSCDTPEMHTGEGTYYDFADGSGNCGFPATPDDLRVAAMNQTDYAGSAACGTCARITGPTGSVTVRVVDRCPECAPGDIDLSPSAFDEIAERSAGRVPIAWTYVPCDVAGGLVYHFKDGSNPWWTGVQVRNHRHAIVRFEVADDTGAFREVPRLNYNYFVDDGGMGEGPFTFRVTDVYGNVATDTGIPLLDDADAPGVAQFPECE